METFALITDLEALEQLMVHSKEQPVLIFKHSTACPVSAQAYRELKEFSEWIDLDELTIRVVHVIENRPVSNEIADRFGIKHESPQAFLIKDEQVYWHASHFHITKYALLSAYNQIRP
ncbi:bacillithiol system protein YtxJ [Thermoflavimicrobium dichotomicum]|uniref:Bacillithiol system protein YtxJ n=2 Tax=Thermoflavimicrobium dichotomicum TaxID=46223 RepID=A0A1I3MK36_9BACL|nr:bacillithiol system protein YtxJ [Thermoflavimicrobium dichotomicum]